MPIESYLFSAIAPEDKTEIEGKILTKPALVYSDGASTTWSADVDIGVEGAIDENGTLGILPLRNVPLSPINRDLIYTDVGSAVILRRDTAGKWGIIGPSKTMPGSFTIIDVTLPTYCLGIAIDPLTLGLPEIPDNELITLIPESVPEYVSDPYSIGIDHQILTYEELATYGSYGTIPYGAVGVFENGTLTSIRSY